MIPTYHEDNEFHFDAEAADRPIRFGAKYLRHYEGVFAGRPFTLLDWQSQLIRTLFGWKRRADGLRRFRELYCLTAKGSGKTPLLALIGMFMLLADEEPAAHVISAATDFQQAYLTLDAAKKYIAGHKTLGILCDPKQFEIRAPKNSKWTVISGTAEGRHGFRPHCLLADEAHEWKSGRLYDNLTANMPKRRQPLTCVTTNAGASRSVFCWKLHERALAVLNGKPGASKTLLPVIFEAPIELQWDSEEAASAANPSMPEIITFDRLEPEITKAREGPEAEARYRRLFLSQWQGTAAGRWINMAVWDSRVSDEKPPDDAPIYVGIDLSQSDDLSALAFVHVTATCFFIESRFWLPRVTAEKYQDAKSIPYSDWAAAGHITLLDEPVIGTTARAQIADAIIPLKKRIKAVAYDPYKADETVATLESACVACVPVTQGFRTSPGCFELEKRLNDSAAIVIAPNNALRFCAENAEIKRNDYGEIRVVKVNTRDRFAGTKHLKIDGISALVTAMTLARKHAFPAVKKQWKGSACLI